jgi:F-type H+-transporting ATPase subunit alpha
MPVEEQVVSVYAGTSGALDDLPVEQVKRFESELLESFRARNSALLSEIRDTGALPEGDTLERAVNDFKAGFVQSLENAAKPDADVTDTDAEAPGDPDSDKTLKTE